MATAAKQPHATTIDSRQFLSFLNGSAQANVAMFESRVSEMGRKAGKVLKLVALHEDKLLFEEPSASQYYFANHKREKGGRVTIDNIQLVSVIEEDRQADFDNTALKLVNAIEADDSRSMHSAYSRMRSMRFSSRTIPSNGCVRTRDGQVHRINVVTEKVLDKRTRGQLVAAVVESLQNRVIVEGGQIVAGTFTDGDPLELPVTKWAGRKIVAKHMREAAKNAYFSPGFQARVLNVASLVCENKIQDAVNVVAPFLKQNEEFTLLTSQDTQRLVENVLATQAIFNQQLCEDVATLFHKTNLRVNRKTIVKEWRQVGRKTEHSALLDNVDILENAKNFEVAYEKFLHTLFEAISNKEVAATSLATTLEMLRTKTPRIQESPDLAGRLSNLISKLRGNQVDDATLAEAEELVANIQEELTATQTMDDFDKMPGGEEPPMDLGGAGGPGGDLGGGLGGAEVGGTGQNPVININAPLIQIGGTSSGSGGGEPEDEGLGDLEPPPEEGGEEDDLEQMLSGDEGAGGEDTLGGAGAAPPGPGAGGMPPAGGQQPPPLEGRYRDPYAVTESELRRSTVPASAIYEYGKPPIAAQNDVHHVVNVMQQVIEKKQFNQATVEEQLSNIAKASIEAVGIRLPKHKMDAAIEQVTEAYRNNLRELVDTAEAEEGVAEDQYHYARIPGRGFKRAAFKKNQTKGSGGGGTASESVQWAEPEGKSVLGEMGGVRFTLLHDDGNNPVIVSEDRAVEIPVPEDVADSAFASAKMLQGDGRPFVEWLSTTLEQLRPISEAEDAALEEAMAHITVTPDGGISVEVGGDVDVAQTDDMGGEMGGEMGMPGDDEMPGEEMAGDADAEMMSPVDSVMPGEEGEGEMGDEMDGEGDDAMPSFGDLESEIESDVGGPSGDGGEMPPGEEGGEIGGNEPPAGPPGGGSGPPKGPPKPPKKKGPPKDDEGMAEELTDPGHGAYGQLLKQDPRTKAEKKRGTNTSGKSLEGFGSEPVKGDHSGAKGAKSAPGAPANKKPSAKADK